MQRWLYLVLVVASSFLTGYGGNEQVGLSRPLTHQELKTFMPLVCENAMPSKSGNSGEYDCNSRIGYPANLEAGSSGGFTIEAIVYGSFTDIGLNQAYITYSGESHTFNWGGGILFQKNDDRWQLIKWFPGHQMNECVSIPNEEPKKMICLFEDMHQGNRSYDVDVVSILPTFEYKHNSTLFSAYSQADGYNLDQDKNICSLSDPKKGFPLQVAHLETGSGNLVAVATISYALPGEVERACKDQEVPNFALAKTKLKIYRKNGKLVALPEVALITLK